MAFEARPAMQLHYTIWIKGPHGEEPLPTWSPEGMISSEQAREDARLLVFERGLAATFLTIEDRYGDGAILEEWFWVRGDWEAKK